MKIANYLMSAAVVALAGPAFAADSKVMVDAYGADLTGIAQSDDVATCFAAVRKHEGFLTEGVGLTQGTTGCSYRLEDARVIASLKHAVGDDTVYVQEVGLRAFDYQYNFYTVVGGRITKQILLGGTMRDGDRAPIDYTVRDIAGDPTPGDRSDVALIGLLQAGEAIARAADMIGNQGVR